MLIPATGFYEHKDPENKKVKLKDRFFFTMKNQEWFRVAGIVQQDCFTMLTTEAGPDVSPYHPKRQIVVLPPDDGVDWLRLSRPQSEILSHLPAGSLDVRMIRKNGELVAA